jgi:hypothetical protein
MRRKGQAVVGNLHVGTKAKMGRLHATEVIQ